MFFFGRRFLKKARMRLLTGFFRASIGVPRIFKKIDRSSDIFHFFFLNRFLLNFVELFFKSKVLFNLKKGSNRLLLRQVNVRKFSIKYFSKQLKTSKQVIGVVYYSLLLKDATMFANFFKKILESVSIKLHKKLLRGLKYLIKDIYAPIFRILKVRGVFINLKGKIGVSGNAKKRRRFFYFCRHSITSRALKVDIKFMPI
jgi:hypothetical protein